MHLFVRLQWLLEHIVAYLGVLDSLFALLVVFDTFVPFARRCSCWPAGLGRLLGNVSPASLLLLLLHRPAILVGKPCTYALIVQHKGCCLFQGQEFDDDEGYHVR